MSKQPLSLPESRYRTVVEDQTEVIGRFLPDGTFTFVNEVYCRVFGKSAEELIGQRWHPVAHPDDLPMIVSKLAEMSPDNPIVIIENRVYVANSELHWMQFVNRGLYDADGHLKEIQSVGRDITLLKQAEAALRESEATLERAQAVARIGSFTMGSDTEQFTYTNETARLFDLEDRRKCRFEEWFSRVHPDDQSAVEAAWGAALQGALYDMTYRIVVRGEIIWIRGVAELTFDEQGRLLECVGTVQDITDLKSKENALRESEERLEMALAGSGLALWDWDIANHKVFAGIHWFSILGYTPDELGSKEDDWFGLVHPDDLEKVRLAIASHFSGNAASYSVEHRMHHKDGHWVALELNGKVTQRDKDNTPLRMVGTVLDITQRKRLNDEGIVLLKQIEALIRQTSNNVLADIVNSKAVESLTKREHQILTMIAGGMTSAQIGKQLKLATNTIISHRQNLMTKLDLHSTAEVTRFAMENGLVNKS